MGQIEQQGRWVANAWGTGLRRLATRILLYFKWIFGLRKYHPAYNIFTPPLPRYSADTHLMMCVAASTGSPASFSIETAPPIRARSASMLSTT